MNAQTPELKPIKFLLVETFKIFSSKRKNLLGIMIIPIAFSLTGWLFDISFPNWELWPWVFKKICFLVSTLFFFLTTPALIWVLKEDLGIRGSYEKAFQIFFPYLWIFLLINIIVVGGFLLLIIPGILFWIWFSLAIYILIFEGKKGMEALFESKDLISGRFWQIFLRFLILGLLILAILFCFFFPLVFLKKENLIEPLSSLLQFLIVPFVWVYCFLIYRNLKEIKKEILPPLSLKRKLKYLLPGILGILILIPIFALNSFHFFLDRDIPPFDDSDLQLSKIDIPPEENAYYELIELQSQIAKIEDWPVIEDYLQGKIWNPEFVQEFLSKNDEIFKRISIAAQKPYFQDPATADPSKFSPDLVIMPMVRLRDISKLSSLKALSLAKEGKGKEALDELSNPLEIAQKIQNSQGVLIHYLVALGMKNIILEKMREIISQVELPTPLLIEYARKLDKFKENEEGLKTAWKAEYTFQKLGVEKVVTGEFFEELEMRGAWLEKHLRENRFYFKPNKTKLYFAENARLHIRNTEKPCGFLEKKSFISLIPIPESIYLVFTENAIGKILHDVIAVSLFNVIEKKCQEDLSVSANQLLLVIKAYKKETGIYPFSLEELVPRYLSVMPQDPFDGKEMKYSSEKKIIYSVGEDLIDSGGSEGERWQDMPDPTFKIEF